jgi:hypothetical protein
MLSTTDKLAWNKLSQDTKDLARRYFMMFPEELVETKRDAVREYMEPELIDGVRVLDRRASRKS